MSFQDFARYYQSLLSRNTHVSPVAADAWRDYGAMVRRILLIA